MSASYPAVLADYLGLQRTATNATDVATCRQDCCAAGANCSVWQWIPPPEQFAGCWIGNVDVSKPPAYFLKSIVGGARLPETMCNASAFPVDTSGCDYMGLSKINSSSAAECQQSCCAWGAGACSIWQWVPVPDGQ